MRKSITLLCLLMGGSCLMAQTPSARFNQFRQNIFDNYSNFKAKILEHYDDFLNGEWHEFEPLFEEESPYTEPKPTELPEFVEVGETETNMAADFNPKALLNELTLPAVNPVSANSGSANDSQNSNPLLRRSVADDFKSNLSPKGKEKRSNFEMSAYKIPDPEFIFGPLPGQKPLPLPEECGLINDGDSIAKSANKFFFDFYGMKAYIMDYPLDILKEFEGFTQTGTHWKMMAAQSGGVETARQLFGLANQHGLNGYLTFRLTEAFVNQKFPDSDINAKMSAVHFLLSNMGYDIRLLMVNDLLTVMMPFDQKIVYASIYLPNENGRNYTILFPEGYERPKGNSVTLRTCGMPPEALGKTSDLRIAGLMLPFKPKDFSISNKLLTLKGVVNENLKPLLYHYPQMPNGDFASSWIDYNLRENLTNQVKQQLGGMNKKDAVNALMSLCHYGFEYKSDQQWHIFEKPYFLEENFLYEYNDCEDRAIFMSYLIWNALELPCQLIQYPGHESVAVVVNDNIYGRYYNTEGMKFYSADPTYRGAHIGLVMDQYNTTVPSIDKLYK